MLRRPETTPTERGRMGLPRQKLTSVQLREFLGSGPVRHLHSRLFIGELEFQ